jgi:hypothetical protein
MAKDWLGIFAACLCNNMYGQVRELTTRRVNRENDNINKRQEV